MRYLPGESDSGLFGGNSNWRGPIWFPVNYLIIESLQKFHHYYGDDFQVECPTGSGQLHTHRSRSPTSIASRLDAAVPQGRARRAAGARPVPAAAERPALPRLRAVPRVLPRRHGPRRRRGAPDRLDRPGREAAEAALAARRGATRLSNLFTASISHETLPCIPTTCPRRSCPRVRRRNCLRGQKALVTGASSGIGRGIALALAEAGADVVVNYSSGEDKARAVVQRGREVRRARDRSRRRRLR